MLEEQDEVDNDLRSEHSDPTIEEEETIKHIFETDNIPNSFCIPQSDVFKDTLDDGTDSASSDSAWYPTLYQLLFSTLGHQIFSVVFFSSLKKGKEKPALYK